MHKLDGHWELTVDTSFLGKQIVFLKLKVDAGILTGTAQEKSSDESVILSDTTLDGDSFSCHLNLKMHIGNIPITAYGSVNDEGNEANGMAIIPMGEFPFTALKISDI